MLTLSSVRELKTYLEKTVTLCDHILQVRQNDRLFNDEMDLKTSKVSQKIVPQDYYKLRIFDSEIELRYNLRIKQYYIYFDLLDFSIIRSKEFLKTFENYDMTLKSFSEKSIYISKDYAFEECVNIFYKVCIFILSHKVHNDILFEVY